MAERDFVGDIITYSFSGIIPIDDLYKTLNKWARAYGYKIIEREHRTLADPDKRNHTFIWTLERKVTDYVRNKIDVEIKAKNLREVKVKNAKRRYYKGSIDFMFSTYIEKDYEDSYGKNPTVKFLREVFDKYVTETKTKAFEKEVLKERDKLIAEIRAFLEVQKLKNIEEK